ncbi:Rieske (2Fe-2S) protein [Natronorubrum sp. FCH18a]|uniref:Rieske (2Fe-2S) protein n=1 Tax=Natronorubrum sp. FCH18a TaxID=3447018 RepID=UPI003F51814A
MSTATTRHEICPVGEILPGDRKIVEIDGLSIGIFNVDGDFHALANVCPHQLADLCRGPLGGHLTAPSVGEYEMQREGEIVRCPRHGWAFDVISGESVFNPHLQTRTFDVEVEHSDGNRPDVDGESCGDRSCSRGAEGEADEQYGTELSGSEPPVDTYEVTVEDHVVVLYV